VLEFAPGEERCLSMLIDRGVRRDPLQQAGATGELQTSRRLDGNCEVTHEEQAYRR
jgi:hypothetical protein